MERQIKVRSLTHHSPPVQPWRLGILALVGVQMIPKNILIEIYCEIIKLIHS